MAVLKFDTNKIETLENEITELIRDEIRRQDLIDTGLMLRSVETKITPSGSNLEIKVSSTDYFKYVDGTYDVIDNAFDTDEYDRIIEDLEDLYIEALENSIEF